MIEIEVLSPLDGKPTIVIAEGIQKMTGVLVQTKLGVEAILRTGDGHAGKSFVVTVEMVPGVWFDLQDAKLWIEHYPQDRTLFPRYGVLGGLESNEPEEEGVKSAWVSGTIKSDVPGVIRT